MIDERLSSHKGKLGCTDILKQNKKTNEQKNSLTRDNF